VGSPQGYDTDGHVIVSVLDGSEAVAGTYRVTFTDSAEYGLELDAATNTWVPYIYNNMLGVTLERLTPTAEVLYSHLLPDHEDVGRNLLPVVDGIRVEVESIWNYGDAGDKHLSYPDYYSPRGSYTHLGDEGYYGSDLDRTWENFANVFFNAEIRWDSTATQMAYVMSNRTSSALGNFVDYHEFPGTVWDVSGATDRQVNIMYSWNSGDTSGYDFDISYPWNSYQHQHYMRILASDYSGDNAADADTAYTTGSMSAFRYRPDGVWHFVPALEESLDIDDDGVNDRRVVLSDLYGSVTSLSFDRPIAPSWEYEYTVTEPAFEDSLIDLDDIKVVPNPYYVYAEWDQSNNRRKIQFTNVPMDSEIQIYTLSGELVAILDHHGDATAVAGGRGYNSNRVGTVDWNIWTYEFTEAAYGLYIYVVKTDDGRTKVGKFAIIR
jgi:hypothetical protein